MKENRENSYPFSVAILALIILSSCVSKVPDSSTGKPTDRSGPWLLDQVLTIDIEGRIQKKSHYIYDDSGVLREIADSNFLGEIQYKRRWNYQNGVVSQLEIFDATGLLSRTRYEKNDRGEVQEAVQEDPKGKLLFMTSFTYNNEGLLQETLASDASNTPQFLSVYRYKKKNLIAIEYRFPDGTLESTLERRFVARRLDREQIVLPDGRVTSSKKFAYKNGLLQKEIHYWETQESRSIQYNYDVNNNIIRETWFNQKGEPYESIEKTWIFLPR